MTEEERTRRKQLHKICVAWNKEAYSTLLVRSEWMNFETLAVSISLVWRSCNSTRFLLHEMKMPIQLHQFSVSINTETIFCAYILSMKIMQLHKILVAWNLIPIQTHQFTVSEWIQEQFCAYILSIKIMQLHKILVAWNGNAYSNASVYSEWMNAGTIGLAYILSLYLKIMQLHETV